MLHDILPNHFSDEELSELRQQQGKQLLQVFYTIWANVAKPEEIIRILDWIELRFDDGSALAFNTGEEHDGIHILPHNFGLEQTRVQQQFNGQVVLERVDMSPSSVWKDLLGQPLSSVGLLPDIGGRVQNHLIQLEFGEEVIEVSLDQDGLVVTRNT